MNLPEPVKTSVGPTILLHSGQYFDLLDPAGSSFGIGDIAHGLSMVCRFAGQCHTFYSVAEHCVHASYLAPASHAYAALMHDAAEAFIGDVTRPLKRLLPEYKAIEKQVERAVFARFVVTGADDDEVKLVDRQMLAAEQRALMAGHSGTWADCVGFSIPEIDLRCWSPMVAEERFLRRFFELTA